MTQRHPLVPSPDTPANAEPQPATPAREPFVPPTVTDLGGLADLTLAGGSL